LLYLLTIGGFGGKLRYRQGFLRVVQPGCCVAHQSMWGPPNVDRSDDGPPVSAFTEGTEGAPESTPDLAGLATKMSAHGVEQDVSRDLAFELVLNQILKQACSTTAATSAAIALKRNGNLVCRATTGAHAPHLGVHLDTRAGLSGACVQARSVQRCTDTETDPRVDQEACRRLGVRSIVVLPLLDGDELRGIFEAFSPRPKALGQRDIGILQALTPRILQSLREADVSSQSAPPEASAMSGYPAEKTRAAAADFDARSTRRKRISTRDQIWTIVLSVLVIGAALLVGGLVGVRLGWKRTAPPSGPNARASVSRAALPAPPATGQELSPHGSAALQRATPAASPVPPRVHENARGSEEPNPGDLVVYQRGKVIFRMPAQPTGAPLPGTVQSAAGAEGGQPGPPASVGGPAVVEVPEEVAQTRLLRRVEPEYPEEARQRQIQGPVILKIQINSGGAVEKLLAVAGDPLLAEAAIRAVKQWRYQPYRVGGRPVEVQTWVSLTFALPAN